MGSNPVFDDPSNPKKRRRQYRSWMLYDYPKPPRSTRQSREKTAERKASSDDKQNEELGKVFGSALPSTSRMNVPSDVDISESEEENHESLMIGNYAGNPSDSYKVNSDLDESDEDQDIEEDVEELPANPDGASGRTFRQNPNLDRPIPNLKTTIYEALLLIMNFSLRHNLTSVATADLCKLINLILSQEVIPSSNYMLNKIFCPDGASSHKIHFFCQDCECYLGEKSECDAKKMTSLLCSVCGVERNVKKMMKCNNFFITIPMGQQIVSLLEQTEDILGLLNFRMRNNNDNICDIFDGSVYKELSQEGEILSHPANLSITCNTDGACVFDSGKNTLWPIHFRINELPPSSRFNQCNAMVCGLWFGKNEPNMSLFLCSFIREAMDLYETGVRWQSPNGQEIVSKIVLLNCVVDSKAKPLLQNVKQFNGYYGCGYCYHPGVVLDEGSNQVKYVLNDDVFLMSDGSFSYTVLGKDRQTKTDKVFQVTDRTNRDMRRDMELAERNEGRNFDVKGVKGISPLFAIPFFDVVNGFAIDYMHCVLLGVTKLVTSLWFDSSSHVQTYYIGNRIQNVDQRLSRMKPPTSISRRPRSLSDRVDWKANEWRSWLLYYSLPCLVDILPVAYLKHHCILVTAIAIFLREEISQEQLESGSWFLMQYVLEFQRLYGRSFMHYNIHLLSHLGKCVKMWGPLWCYSTFSFESGNGCLVKLVKGTRGVITQIARKFTMCKNIPLTVKMYTVSGEVLQFCEELMSYSSASIATKIIDVTLLGSQKKVRYSPEEQNLLLNKYSCLPPSYERMIKRDIMHHARCYARRGEKSDDSVVKLIDGTYGVIEKIFNITVEAALPTVIVLIRPVNIARNKNIVVSSCGAAPSHIKVCAELVYGNLRLVPASDISKKCMMMCSDVQSYIVDFPNIYEKD